MAERKKDKTNEKEVNLHTNEMIIRPIAYACTRYTAKRCVNNHSIQAANTRTHKHQHTTSYWIYGEKIRDVSGLVLTERKKHKHSHTHKHSHHLRASAQRIHFMRKRLASVGACAYQLLVSVFRVDSGIKCACCVFDVVPLLRVLTERQKKIWRKNNNKNRLLIRFVSVASDLKVYEVRDIHSCYWF